MIGGGLATELPKLGKLGGGKKPDLELHPDRVANAENAIIGPRKFTEYALNPDHPVGGNKAKVFEPALGYDRSDADDLIEKIREGVQTNPAVPGKVDQYGSRFTVDMMTEGPGGSAIVRTGWIIKPGETIPQMTATFVK
ncbi:hypothetical protein LZG04_27550 [Saccharothrix sp. S26]|uniref:DUF6883 domain-containing protein n=1 Tax=Saccharothrix sp. S26 TaxID=2907215 RepID=UPI001F45F219|nr:DUF6883 domain-containing protein [Saccharothrix sp. S26]MCE6998527.1 hypothetical protein [Saccharothrix sp. S26]